MPSPDLTPEERAAKIAKLPAWARNEIATLENLTRTLHAQLQAAREHGGGITQENFISGAVPDDAPVLLPDWITLAPDGDHVTDAVYPRQMHVWHGPHSTSAGAEVLVVESGEVPLIIRPVSRTEIVIARG